MLVTMFSHKPFCVKIPRLMCQQLTTLRVDNETITTEVLHKKLTVKHYIGGLE